MTVQVEIHEPGGPIWLHSEFRHKEQCKLVPGAKWDAKDRTWKVPLSWAACHSIRGIFGEELVIGENLAAWSWQEYNERVKPAVDLRMATDAEGDEALYPFQRAGVHFLLAAGSAILGDEMGTGKTVQTAVFLRETMATPCLVVCPKSVKSSWRRELEKWVPDIPVHVAGTTAKEREAAIAAVTRHGGVLVINYEQLVKHSRLAPYGSIKLTDAEKLHKELNSVPWRTVVIDEAHRIKNPKAKQTRAAWWVGHQGTVEHRLALTGTPIANAPDDLWSILHFVAPDEWPSKTKFVDRYCLTAYNPFGGLDVVGVRPDTRDEFFAVVDPRFRRMPKDLVLPFLPPKVRTVRETPMTPKQAKAYREMNDQMIVIDEDTGEALVSTESMTKHLRMLQFSSAYAQVQDGEVVLTDPSNKVDELMDVLEELGDEPLVVFAMHKKLINLAAERLTNAQIPFRLIVGGQTEADRTMAIDDFQSGKVRVILATIAAGGEGITLTRARHLCFLQRSWSMLMNRQAEDRVHRIGSEVHEHVHIIDMVAPDTVEEEQIEALLAKFERLQEIARDRATLLALGDQAAIERLDHEESLIMNSDLTKEVASV